MLFGLFSTTKPAFGLDVSADSFKIIELAGKREVTAVKGYSDVSLPKGLVLNDAIVDKATFGYLIKKALMRPDFGYIDTSYVVGSLPESKSFVRVIQLPKMSESEADSAVQFEAESFIPMPLDQVYLDWQLIGDRGDKMDVLIIACPREFVDKYIEAVESAGLNIAALEVESQSCARTLVPFHSRETTLIVDLDSYRTSLIMVEGGSLQFTSTVPIAGSSFTEGIARALGISSVKAEAIKRKVGIANTPEYPNLQTSLVPVLNNLAGEIKNIVKFHSEHSNLPVEKILLCGGSAKLKALPEFLSLELADLGKVKVELANPWLNLPGIKHPPLSAYDSLSLSTSIGLAMRGYHNEID